MRDFREFEAANEDYFKPQRHQTSSIPESVTPIQNYPRKLRIYQMNEIMDNDNAFKKYLETAKWNSLPDEFVVFDTETTGLTPKSDRILEIGAILFRKDDYLKTGEVTTFQCFIKQDKPIPTDATAINGITDDMVKDGDSEYAALTKFFEFVESRPLFAYNAKFDKDFLKATAKRCEYFDEDFSLEVEDVMPLVSEVFTDLPNRKLTTVAKHIGGVITKYSRLAELDLKYQTKAMTAQYASDKGKPFIAAPIPKECDLSNSN